MICEKCGQASPCHCEMRVQSLDETYCQVKGRDQLTDIFHELRGAGLMRPPEVSEDQGKATAAELPIDHQISLTKLIDRASAEKGGDALLRQMQTVLGKDRVREV